MNRNPAREYLERQVLSASATERVVLAYDGAIRFLLAARKAIEEGNIEARFINNKRAADIITYLMDTLDMERGGEVAQNLRKMYGHMLGRMIQIDLRNSVEPLDEVVQMLRNLRAAWEKISRGETNPEKQSEGEAEAPPSKVTASA